MHEGSSRIPFLLTDCQVPFCLFISCLQCSSNFSLCEFHNMMGRNLNCQTMRVLPRRVSGRLQRIARLYQCSAGVLLEG